MLLAPLNEIYLQSRRADGNENVYTSINLEINKKNLTLSYAVATALLYCAFQWLL